MKIVQDEQLKSPSPEGSLPERLDLSGFSRRRRSVSLGAARPFSTRNDDLSEILKNSGSNLQIFVILPLHLAVLPLPFTISAHARKLTASASL